jgi:hypothetical protein
VWTIVSRQKLLNRASDKVLVGNRPDQPMKLLLQLDHAFVLHKRVKRATVECWDVLLMRRYQILNPVAVPYLEQTIWEAAQVTTDILVLNLRLLWGPISEQHFLKVIRQTERLLYWQLVSKFQYLNRLLALKPQIYLHLNFLATRLRGLLNLIYHLGLHLLLLLLLSRCSDLETAWASDGFSSFLTW